MNTYEAHATRDGNSWTISVPAVDGSTQAPTISDVTTRAKEHVAGTLDVPPSTVEVHLESLDHRHHRGGAGRRRRVSLLLRNARARPSGQHRGPGRARRRDPHDPIRQDNEEPPELDQP